MSEGSMRVYSKEFKEAALQRIAAGETLREVSRALGIARKLLYDWRAAYRAHGAAGLGRKRGRKPGLRALAGLGPKPRPVTAAAELAQARARIAELERKIGRQQMELDFFQRALHLVDGEKQRACTAPTSTGSSKK